MITFYSIQNGKTIKHEAEIGSNLMLALGIMGDCGGACVCSTCHVHITPTLAGISEDEKITLDIADEVGYNSRLSCQVLVDKNLENKTVRVVNNAVLY